MDEPQVELVQAEALAVDFPFMGASVTVRTQINQVIVLALLALRPRENVHVDEAAGRDGAPMPSLDQNAPA